MNWFNKIHWPAVGAAILTGIGIASQPAVLGLMPASVATGVAAAGIVAQAVTKGVQHGNTTIVPKAGS